MTFLEYLQQNYPSLVQYQRVWEEESPTGPYHPAAATPYQQYLQSQAPAPITAVAPSTTTTETAPITKSWLGGATSSTTYAPAPTTDLSQWSTLQWGPTTTSTFEGWLRDTDRDKFLQYQDTVNRGLSGEEGSPEYWQQQANQLVAPLRAQYDQIVSQGSTPATSGSSATTTTASTATAPQTLDSFLATLTPQQRETYDNFESPQNRAAWLAQQGFTGTGQIGSDFFGNYAYVNGQAMLQLPNSSDAGLTIEQQYAWRPETAALFAGATEVDGNYYVNPNQYTTVLNQVAPDNDQFSDFLSQYGPALVGGAFMGAGALSGTDAAATGSLGSDVMTGAAGAGAGDTLGTTGALIGAEDAALIDAASAGAGGNLAGGAAGAGALDVAAGGAVDMGVGGSIADAIGGIQAAGAGAGATGWLGTAASAINSALGTNLNDADLMRILGGVASGVGGYVSADQMGDAYRDINNQFLALGAPARARLEAAQAPGFDIWSIPGLRSAADRSADISTRKWSADAGNPANNPTAQAGIYQDVLAGTTLPAYFNWLGLQGQHGGLGLNTSGMAAMAGAGATGQQAASVGYGLGRAFTPSDPYQEFINNMNKQFALTVGGQKV